MKKCCNQFVVIAFLSFSFLIPFSDATAQESETPVWYENQPADTERQIFVVEKGENSLEALTLALGKLANKISELENRLDDQSNKNDAERTITVHNFGDYQVAIMLIKKEDSRSSSYGIISEKAIRIKSGEHFLIEYFYSDEGSFERTKTEINYSTIGKNTTLRNLIDDLQALGLQFTTHMSLTIAYVMISMPIDHR